MSFWDFKACAKYDEITENVHPHLIQGALGDEKTGVELLDTRTYILYGENEALIFRPTLFIYKIGVEFIRALTGLIK